MASSRLHHSYPTVHLACDAVRPRVLEGADEPTLRCSTDKEYPATVQVLISRDQAWAFLTYVRLQVARDDLESGYGLKVPCHLHVEPRAEDMTLGVVGSGPVCDDGVACLGRALEALKRDPKTVLGHTKAEFPGSMKGYLLFQGQASHTSDASALTEVHVPMAVIAHLFESDERPTHILFEMDVSVTLHGDARLADHTARPPFTVHGHAA